MVYRKRKKKDSSNSFSLIHFISLFYCAPSVCFTCQQLNSWLTHFWMLSLCSEVGSKYVRRQWVALWQRKRRFLAGKDDVTHFGGAAGPAGPKWDIVRAVPLWSSSGTSALHCQVIQIQVSVETPFLPGDKIIKISKRHRRNQVLLKEVRLGNGNIIHTSILSHMQDGMQSGFVCLFI